MTDPTSSPRLSRARLIGRGIVIALVDGVAALAGILLLGLVLLAIRLQIGPIEVDFLTPVLTAALNRAADPLSVALRSTSVSWNAGHATVDLVANDLKVTDPAGATVLTLPKLAVSLSLEALVHGEVVPTRLTAIAPKLLIIRAASGEIGVQAGTDAVPAPPSDYTPPEEPVPQMLRSIAGKPRSDDPLGHLNRISIERADVTVDDRATGLSWQLKAGYAAISRSPTGLDAEFGGNVGLASAEAAADASLHFDSNSRQLGFNVALQGLNPATLAEALPATLGPFSGLRAVLDGNVTGNFDVGAMRLGATQFHLKGGSGSLVSAKLSQGTLVEKQLLLDAAYDPAGAQLTLSRFFADLGGPTIEANAVLSHVPADLNLAARPGHPMPIKATAALHHVPIDRFDQIWPPSIAADAREWVTANLSVGTLDDLKVDAGLTYDPTTAAPITLAGLAGRLTVSNATILYLPGLPKLTGVDATATISPQRLDFAITSGHLRGLTIPQGRVLVDGLDGSAQILTIDTGIRGPVEDVLGVLDVPRLQLAKQIGVDPTQTAGTVDGTLHFQLPLKKDLPFDAVDYGAKAQIADLGLKGAAFGRDLSDGNFALTLDHRSVTLDGTGKLDGVPATVTWVQRISGNTGPESEVHVAARLDDHARQRFDLDPLPDYLQGPVDAVAVYRKLDDHRSEADVTLGLQPAELAIDWAGWAKPPGTSGTASLTVKILDDHVRSIEKLHVKADDFAIDGRVDIAGSAVSHIEVAKLLLGATNVSGTIDHAPDKPWQIHLNGPALDLTPIRKRLDSTTHSTDTAGPHLMLDIKSDLVTLGPKQELHAADIHADIARHTLLSGTIGAIVGQHGKMSFQLSPVETGGKFSITTDDLGAFAKATGISGNVAGGSATLTGTSVQEGDARRFTGRLEGKDYRIENGPFMARLLSLASFQSMGSLLAGEGIPFSTLRADLSLKEGRLDLTNGRAFGTAIGMNASGWFDFHAGTLMLNGTLVPAYLLNSALSGVPIVGGLLAGGEGQGLFAANVAIGGAIAEPQITVNPLSALAPGFLRNFFLFDAPTPETAAKH
jgi:hypothetical protein